MYLLLMAVLLIAAGAGAGLLLATALRCAPRRRLGYGFVGTVLAAWCVYLGWDVLKGGAAARLLYPVVAIPLAILICGREIRRDLRRGRSRGQ